MKVKYEGFIKRQEAQVARQAGKMNKPIPPGLDYHAITTLRMEAGSRLYAHTVPPKLYTLAASIQGLKEVIPKP